MKTNSRMYAWAIKTEDDFKEYMDMTVCKRLVGEEIICHSLKEDGIISFWFDTDEKWKKTISIL